MTQQLITVILKHLAHLLIWPKPIPGQSKTSYPHSTEYNKESAKDCAAWSPLQSQSLSVWGPHFSLYLCTAGSLAGSGSSRGKQVNQAFTKLPRHDITCFTIWALNFISAYLDVSVRDINVVEKIDGRADVPHNLWCLWEEKQVSRLSQTRSNSSVKTTGGTDERELALTS